MMICGVSGAGAGAGQSLPPSSSAFSGNSSVGESSLLVSSVQSIVSGFLSFFFFYFVNLSVSVGVTFALSLFTGNDSLMSMLAGAGVHPSSHQHQNHNIQQHISSPAGGVSVFLCINLYTVSC